MNSSRKYRNDLLKNAKLLRETATSPERILWSYIKNRQFNGYKFRRQQPIGEYVVDFYCSEAKLIIELDGGQHNTPDAIVYDNNRDLYFKNNGYTVIRVWNNELLNNCEGVLEKICEILPPATPPRS